MLDAWTVHGASWQREAGSKKRAASSSRRKPEGECLLRLLQPVSIEYMYRRIFGSTHGELSIANTAAVCLACWTAQGASWPKAAGSQAGRQQQQAQTRR
jgi:hypothetical protein